MMFPLDVRLKNLRITISHLRDLERRYAGNPWRARKIERERRDVEIDAGLLLGRLEKEGADT